LGRFDPPFLIIFALAAPFTVAVHLCNQLRDFDEEWSLAIHSLVQRLGWSRSVRLCAALLAISPLPFLIGEITAGQHFNFYFMLAASGFFWGVTCLYLYRNARSLGVEHFRSLFRRLQIGGPPILIIWFWLNLVN
jgi:1,4-dihydroxy-2-naphthoate octaprenyltransferase